MNPANQALVFESTLLEDCCVIPAGLSGKIELTHKLESELQISITDLVEETHIVRISRDIAIRDILAKAPLPKGEQDCSGYQMQIRFRTRDLQELS